MAQNGRVFPNCVYASNPYHECTEACLRKITETKPQKAKKNSDYRSVNKDGELRKNISACPKASNPYHECDENCAGAYSGSVLSDISLKLGRRKKQNSWPESPQGISDVYVSKTAYPSNVSSPKSYYSEDKKVDSRNHDDIPSLSPLGKLLDQDASFRKGQPLSSQAEPTSENVMLVSPNHPPKGSNDVEPQASPTASNQKEGRLPSASPQVAPINSLDDSRLYAAASPTGSQIFNFSGVSPYGDSDGEAESVISESRVSVGRYRVKENLASIMQSIFDKYGDIAANCHLESDAMRSYYLECVCFIIQELQSTPSTQLTKSKVKELLAILKDVESAQFRVAWLHSVLDELAECVGFVNQFQAMKLSKAECERDIESTKTEMESELEILAQKEREVAVAKTRVAETRERLKDLELKSSELSRSVVSLKSKVDGFDCKSLLDDLL